MLVSFSFCIRIFLKCVGVCTATSSLFIMFFYFSSFTLVEWHRRREFCIRVDVPRCGKKRKRKFSQSKNKTKKKMRENFYKSVDVSPHNSVLFSRLAQNDKGGGRDVGRSRVFGSAECDFISEKAIRSERNILFSSCNTRATDPPPPSTAVNTSFL